MQSRECHFSDYAVNTLMSCLNSQLAVVQGLVMDRKEANRGNVVFDERCCRASYGMLCRQLYNPITHIGEEVYFDPRDRRKWAIRQIDWFVEQVSITLATSRILHLLARAREKQYPAKASHIATD